MADWTTLSNTAVGVGGLPSGATVTALRDNPIAIAEDAPGAPPMVGMIRKISQTVISGSPATVDIFWDNALYDSIHIELSNATPTTTGVKIYARLSDDGTTFASAASSYSEAYLAISTASTVTSDNTETSDFIRLTPSPMGNTAGGGASGTIEILGINDATRFTPMNYHIGASNSSATLNQLTIGSAMRRTNGVVKGIRFYASSGTLLNGLVTVYGVWK